MQKPRWKTVGGTLLRVTAVWAVATLTMLALAGILPDFRLKSDGGDSATRIAITAAIGAGVFGVLSALVWPLLVRALLLMPALVLGLLVFVLNGSMLLIAISLIPDGRGAVEPETAVVVAAVMSAASSATSTFLAVRDDGAYRRRLARLAGRRRRRLGEDGGSEEPPGTVFLQLDGVGHAVLRGALRERDNRPPVMPTVARLIRSTHKVTPWRTDWSSQTGASQLGILHGSNEDVPAFRWYEKKSGEVMVSNRPTSAAVLQRRAAARAGHDGLLTVDGASRGNLFTGGADQLALVLSVAARRGPHNRSRSGYFAYFADPANATRTAVSFLAEVVREICQSTRAKLRRETPRVKRGGLYPFIRAFATVVERDVVVTAVMGDILSGRTAIYADLVAYDEVAHHSGPRSRDARQVLARLDRSIALIAKVADRAPRDYRIVLLSDHGQSPGETFAGAYGLTLEDLVRVGCGLPVSRRAGRTPSGAEAREAGRAALHRPEKPEVDGDGRCAGRDAWGGRGGQGGGRGPADAAGVAHKADTADPAGVAGGAAPASDPIVLASGNLGLVSFPDVPGRMSREQIDARHPALLRTLADHPGVGFLLVRSEAHGAVVLGAEGAEHRLDTGEVFGASPLTVFGPGAEAAVRRTAHFRNTPDIMVNSAYDPARGTVHAFEEQIGSHGGLGGEQGHPFLLWPAELTPPVAAGEELVGAERVHRVLRRWLEEADGPQVPEEETAATGERYAPTMAVALTGAGPAAEAPAAEAPAAQGPTEVEVPAETGLPRASDVARTVQDSRWDGAPAAPFTVVSPGLPNKTR
ncbi:phage holin family protein [Streptomyces violaceusniger]|uniref:Type I phosphodiesterase/nucleotide pyrophosphatase n=1 Tax=Streptomyces violaceusniger (strain Tu 4113) TaxID=653045 RepID=G2PDJ2_STRV4|nr:phage holin family protein [Streptomyces violaceusniger]AEM82292.1 type I phosphodiesterase/nucleotide pyrophosphatase [Streptomyces violaceusniger Tu 4113]